MEKCALLFQFEEQKAQRLKKTLSRLGIAVRQVEPEEYSTPLGILAGLPGGILFMDKSGAAGKIQEVEPDQEMLVFSGITRQELDRALDAMRRTGLAGIALKAMLTETNCFWNAKQLTRELKREREAMCRQMGITND
ncbi:MAG TPA: DUF3783 domain-containing protein [Candidatus Eisenbergiella merdipullorum]|uniref:DUF3783 domain-containing protein n=1 Tax=Candidatus Eisenbergiella merdipullorum TaxID=2838553 RepID=A0A9D2I719_9FIRM|nr:DUF3783 domain-containing protein [Candidatus Eisenbergiella merdipullorum]